MGRPLRKPVFTLDDYLAWENEQPEKHEYVDGEVFLMVGARDVHNIITGNLYVALRQHLKGTPCRTYASDIKLRVEAANCVFYPDVFVNCAAAADPLVKRDAVLVAEVLSPSTEAYDRGRKFGFYRQLPALREYLLVSADEPRIELYRRSAEGHWVLHDIPADGVLPLESVGLKLPAAAVFEEVDFTPPPTGEAPA